MTAISSLYVTGRDFPPASGFRKTVEDGTRKFRLKEGLDRRMVQRVSNLFVSRTPYRLLRGRTPRRRQSASRNPV